MDTHFKDPLSEIERMFQQFMNHVQQTRRLPAELFSTHPGPNVNICETDGSYVVLAELPGADPQSTQITVKDNTVIIQGERKTLPEISGIRCLQLEINFGPFRRVLRLPASVNQEEVKAEFRYGMLTILLPKKPKDSSIRQISIEVKE
jgi:HSP20 family protein